MTRPTASTTTSRRTSATRSPTARRWPRGPRIPTMVISPFAASGKISHRYSEHGSVIKFINELKGLAPLATLPDEQQGARRSASASSARTISGPSDDPNNKVGDLTEAFDYDRSARRQAADPGLGGDLQPDWSRRCRIWRRRTTRPTATPTAPARRSACCRPTSSRSPTIKAGKPIDPYPADVNPRPTQSPGTPTSGNWTP